MGDPRWLDEEEQATWRAFLAMVDLLRESLERQMQNDSGMPHTYYLILAMLSEAPGRAMRMSDLADLTSSSPSRMSHAVARLEEYGWVRRGRQGADRRTNVATLTGEGSRVLTAAAPGHVEAVRQGLFDALTPEQVRQLGEISRDVVARLDRNRIWTAYHALQRARGGGEPSGRCVASDRTHADGGCGVNDASDGRHAREALADG